MSTSNTPQHDHPSRLDAEQPERERELAIIKARNTRTCDLALSAGGLSAILRNK